jgi:ATP-dependent RNA circularization protein (DNA/RNA ligase family)
MDRDFVKFPRTPHLFSLTSKPLRGDRLLSNSEAASFLEGDIVIEEKVDGANIGISVSPELTIQVQNRGAYIDRPAPAQFQPLDAWLGSRSDQLLQALGQDFILFGEWCYAVHSIRYENLPDWFIGFDIYDRVSRRFFSADRRDKVLRDLHIVPAARIATGHFSMDEVTDLVEKCLSAYGPDNLEGVYLRRESGGWLEQRAKCVRPEFMQAIADHWSSRPLSRNRILR